MQYTLIASAGLAEAAWMMAMMLMGGGMLVICFVAFLTLETASRKLAVTSVVLLIAFSLFFQPWYCFVPFEADAYDDPDVVSATDDFRIFGIMWVLTSLLVLVSSTIAWLKKRRLSSMDTTQTTL
tara:strand:+ start:132 stop:506 length:375 start_codon:yes stop_codon:yes gene_type:complete